MLKLIDALRHAGNRRAWEAFGRTDPLWAVLSDSSKRGGKWDVDEFFATGAREIAGVIDRLTGLGLQPPRRLAVDFGCGVGRLTRALAAEFDQVIGVDLSEAMVAEARRLNAAVPNVRFVHNPSTSLDGLASGSVDFVYSRLVLQHIPSHVAAGYVREFVRMLAPDGIAVFGAPDQDPRPRFFGLRSLARALREVIPGQHRMSVYAVPRRNVEAAVREAGGTLLAAIDDPSPPGWTGFIYVVGKSTGARIGA